MLVELAVVDRMVSKKLCVHSIPTVTVDQSRKTSC